MSEYKTIATEAVPVTDRGEFTAIAAAWTEDRGRDIIHRGAFSNTIAAWRRSGKALPLHWDHEGDPDKIIGHIDPLSMVERDDGLYVEGALDIEHSQLAREAWRLVKAGVVGLSFGFVPTRVKNRDGGGRHLHAVDEFEISLTPAPMNPDARILSMKRLTALDKRVDEQTARAHRHVQQLLDNDQDERAAQLLCEFDTGGAW